jgi:hypothetical protein
LAFLRLTELRSELAVRLRQPGLSTAQRDLWLNIAQDDVATYLDPEHLVVPYTFTTVSGTRKYFLDQTEFLKILSMRDVSNVLDLSERTMQEIEAWDPDYTDTGTSKYYIPFGLEYVRAQPGSAGVATVVSSSASDTTQSVRINGLVSGAQTSESISLNGTTTATGTVTWDAGTVNTLTVFSAVKSAVTVGRVTVARGSDTLAIIPPSLFAEERHPVYLWPEPAAANTIRGHVLRRPRKMVNAEDFPDFPVAFHELVLIGAVIKGHLSMFNFRAADELNQKYFLPAVGRLEKQQGNTRGKYSPVIGGADPVLGNPTWNVPTLTGP